MLVHWFGKKMPQPLKILAALVEGPNMDASTQTRRLTTASNSNHKESDALLWTLRAPKIKLSLKLCFLKWFCSFYVGRLVSSSQHTFSLRFLWSHDKLESQLQS